MPNPKSSSLPSPVADILRKRGFVPLPRLWVRKEDMPTIHAIAEQYKGEVMQVRRQVRDEEAQLSDPMTDREAAWEAAERALQGTAYGNR